MARMVENVSQRRCFSLNLEKDEQGFVKRAKGGEIELVVKWADSGQRNGGFKGPSERPSSLEV